eukprot:gnl/MRDRNA2_/MRDRNA2_101640_c0_seq1.p1 gnl/MRDRNA2_/MRDRNA2_101640_c0~~gnl/MRDRNA2_/MRDRNA2_101640_c0_seq1.p1  ORF type:complete len:457 (-),score=126.83 gnl/MRDRNA2_/MRDRNA2_101640_c0_seq1:311-1681(-)
MGNSSTTNLRGQTIAVVGVTGQQGGAVMDALLSMAPLCTIRGITRDASTARAKEVAQKLGNRGHIVEANLDDVESLKVAFQGCKAVFGVTNFWDKGTMGIGGTINMDPKKEATQGKNIGDAAKAAGVGHLIFSSLEDTRQSKGIDRIPRLGQEGKVKKDGEYLVPHFDGKNEAQEYIKTLGIPLTIVWTPGFMSNFENVMKPVRVPCSCGGADIYIFSDAIGTTSKQPLIDMADIGKAVAALFLMGPPEGVRGPVGIATEMKTGPEIAATFAAALGVRAVYCPIAPWLFRKFPFPAAPDLGNMMQWMRECPDFCGNRDIEMTRKMVPDYTDLKAYFRANHAFFLPTNSKLPIADAQAEMVKEKELPVENGRAEMVQQVSTSKDLQLTGNGKAEMVEQSSKSEEQQTTGDGPVEMVRSASRSLFDYFTPDQTNQKEGANKQAEQEEPMRQQESIKGA